MKLTILGSGAALSSKDRAATSFLLEIGKDKILMDCGYGSFLRLKEAGYYSSDITHILITHTHFDHVADLISLAWEKPIIKEVLKKSIKPITIVGPRGFKKYLEKSVNLLIPGIDFECEVKEVSNSRIKFNNWLLKVSFVANQKHTYLKPAVAYKVEHKNKILVYLGDTRLGDFSKRLLNFIRGADVLIIEASLPESFKMPAHLTPGNAGKIASLIGAKKIILNHFTLPIEKEIHLVKKQAAKYYKGPIILAKDLMKINI